MVQAFADAGSSGALAFCEGQHPELFCVGMVEGGISAGTCILVPTLPFLQELGGQCFKRLENDKIQRELETLKKGVQKLKKRR